MDGLKSRPQKKKLSKNLLQMKSQVIVVPQESLENNPLCAHGPTILFRRGNKEEFTACSAFRDPKQCKENAIGRKPALWSDKENPPSLYCHTCESLDSDSAPHSSHETTPGPLDTRFPSSFLRALTNDKAQAQYHFQATSSEFILKAVLIQKETAVLCIGAPTIHEMLRCRGVDSLMMDIDNRYASFYPMLLYNMFNHHFFDPRDRDVYNDFLKEHKHLSVVMDPPFGGKTELLGASLRRIQSDLSAEGGGLRVFWIFPYFMERNILDAFEGISMMGVPIEYQNHAKYSRRKQGSPVRLFTNASYKEVPLPRGYRRCHVCRVVSGGRHCGKCNACPSKNGGTYNHCDECGRCVKDSWTHCGDCHRCALSDHPCDLFQSKKKRKF